jgi:translation initiation factor IF-2
MPREKQVRDVVVPEAITVQELANRMAEKGADLVKALFKMGMMVTVNQTIDQDTAELLVEEFGHNIQRVSESDVDIDTADGRRCRPKSLQTRPPVVTIMGHVDHGKTSLLDALRGTDVVRGEAGGITQHIGAYQIKTKGGDLWSPSSILRATRPSPKCAQRGANVTDIVVLVVAADDGLMPQTIEAIHHTKAAGVPMIVAITKSDKPEANPQKIRERLLEHEIVVEADVGRRPGRRSFGQDRQGPGRADREDPAAGRTAGTAGQSGSRGRSDGDRGQARQGQGAAGHRAGQSRHAEGGRHPSWSAPERAACAR